MTVHVTVLAGPEPEWSHWLIVVTGVVEVVVPLGGQLTEPLADPVQLIVRSIVAEPVG